MAKAAATIKIEGARELDRALSELAKRVRNKIAKKAIRAASTPMMKAMRRNAPKRSKQGSQTKKRPGVLKRSIARKLWRSKRTGNHVAIIGPRSKAAPHAWLVENGTAPRVQTSTGRFTGSMPPNAFMRKAFDANRRGAVNIMVRHLRIGIETETRKIRGMSSAGTLSRLIEIGERNS